MDGRRRGAVPRHVVWTVLLLASLFLAGCTGSAPPDADEADPHAPPDGGAPAEVEPPVWRLRDYWTYTSTAGQDLDLVVVGETGSDWIIGTDSADTAFFDARSDVSTQGPQRKSDLAGSQGDDRVVFFQWPLTDGAEWTTRWDGVERRIVAQANDDGTWTFDAHEGTNRTVRYGYDPAVRWFTHLDFYAPDGTVAFGYRLSGHGANWTGDTYRWSLRPLLGFDQANTMAYSTQPIRFEVTAAETDVWASFDIGCTQGAIVVGIHPVPWDAGAVGRRWNTGCTGPWTFEGSLGHLSGTWNLDFAWHDTAQGPARGDVYVRTLETIPVA